MTVDRIMSSPPVTIGLDTRLRVIRDLFEKHRFHHLLVVEKGRLFGVISDRDLLKALSPFLDTRMEQERDAATLNKHAHQIMTRKPVCVTPDTIVPEAAHLLLHHRVSCLPVVQPNPHPVGILTWRDIFQRYYEITQ